MTTNEARELLLHRMLWTARGYSWRLVPRAPHLPTKPRRRKRPAAGQQAAR